MIVKRLTATLTVALATLGLAATGASPAAAALGVNEAEVSFRAADGSPQTQAGSHPAAMISSFRFDTECVLPGGGGAEGEPDASECFARGGSFYPRESVKDVLLNAPPGFVADPTATPRCSGAEFADINTLLSLPACSNSSAIGLARVEIAMAAGHNPTFYTVPLYNLVPGPGAALKLGFVVYDIPVTIEAGIAESPPYRAVARSTNISQAASVYSATVELWGNPAEPVHDPVRGNCVVANPTQEEAAEFPGAAVSRGDCPVSMPEIPVLTLPTSCGGPLHSILQVDSWQEPAPSFPYFETEIETPATTDCSMLGFSPEITAEPTSHSAESPSGLSVEVKVPSEGLLSYAGTAQSTIKKATVTLPEGVTINPSQAEGLGTCAEAQIGRETYDSPPGAGCPGSSKVGTVEVETPLLEGEVLKGALYVATPYANPFHSLIALYMTVKSEKLGIAFKLPGEVSLDPRTGQVTGTFDELPELPFSSFRLHFSEGARSPLVTPPSCGSYVTKAIFTPWANPSSSREAVSVARIVTGPGGTACPSGAAPFRPGFGGGTISNAAAAYSPLFLRLTRDDGEADLTRFSSILPPGLTGKLAGVSECPPGAVAAAAGKSGRAELAAPSCPASSLIGHTTAGAGVGGALTWVPGSLYLGGPYQGAPLSVISITPAVAGPFDVGTVVVREALRVDPVTAEVEADGAASTPIPRILAGIPLRLRDLRLSVDRSRFTLNATNCEEEHAAATLWGGGTALLPLPDTPVARAARYQAAGCAALPFKPRLKLRLKGSTGRIGHPALKAVLTAAPGEANIGRAQVNLPHAEFLDQGNIDKACTKPVLVAGNCPARSVYGHAKVWTPLLEAPLEGNVYLVGGYGYKLPALVADLNGQIRITLIGKVDSGKNKGIRSTFEAVPDAPVSRFVLEMKGGKKYGLLENSENLCRASKARRRAIVRFTGQNGAVDQYKPVVRNDCGKRHARKRSGHKGHKRRR